MEGYGVGGAGRGQGPVGAVGARATGPGIEVAAIAAKSHTNLGMSHHAVSY